MSSIVSTVDILQNKELSLDEKLGAMLVGLVPLIMSVVQSWNFLKEANEYVRESIRKRQAVQALDQALLAHEKTLIDENAAKELVINLATEHKIELTKKEIAARAKKIMITQQEAAAEGTVTAAKNAEITVTGLLTAAQEKLNISVMKFPLMWIVAAVAAVVGVAVWAIKSYQTAEEKAASALEEVNKNYQELSTTVSNYENAKKGIEGLTEGTLE